MDLYTRFVVLIAKAVSLVLRLSGVGAGGTWPGEIALRMRPGLLHTLTAGSGGVIVIAGTNGKTTTAKMIETILSYHRVPVYRNTTGANLDNGIISAFIRHTNALGSVPRAMFIFEIDEATLPNVLTHLNPRVVVLLNLFRDQLDRYGEVDTIAEKWATALEALDSQTTVVINGDDPHLVHLGSKTSAIVRYFGLDDTRLYRSTMQHATDTIYCPRCGSRLTFGGVYFSHLGKWTCGKCKLTHPRVHISHKDAQSPIDGVYNNYNTLAAILAGEAMGIQRTSAKEALAHFVPAFGRMETIPYQGSTVHVLLSKNPTGFNESLQTVLDQPGSPDVLIALNDRIPDGTDVSWIWDVDFELLEAFGGRIVVTGDRIYDMANRLQYAGVDRDKLDVRPELGDAIHSLTDGAHAKHVWILATYSAMLDARKVLTGRRIE